MDKNTIEVKIKNQSFKEKINSVKYYLFYAVSVRGHFASLDINSESYYDFASYAFEAFPEGYPKNMLKASNSEYTTISICLVPKLFPLFELSYYSLFHQPNGLDAIPSHTSGHSLLTNAILGDSAISKF
ncbi:MAG: hypothetical protein LBQ98_07085, partial [Nitrososphaerota archaeon]|nr:hypothetical protein [Nitrososphaerota archaeon]